MRFERLRRKFSHRQKYFFWTVYGILLLVSAIVGGLSGMLLGYSIDLPQVEELQEVRPNVVSYVYSADGQVLGEFALEKRILVTYDQIPETLKQAILAAEDANFFDHSGIDFRRFFTAVVRNLLYGQLKGASTLTMQLCKLRFTSTEKSIERKIKDMLFAINTEKKFSKEQIFTLYFNQIYMGHGIYGVAAAADFYFGKTLDELTLAECTLLAAILNVPEIYSPIRHPDRALRRRNNYVLRRMYEEGYIDRETFRETSDEPIQIAVKNERQTAAYFVEWVRQHLERNYTTKQIWKGGLKVYTTLDSRFQVAALEALSKGLKAFDKQHHPWTGADQNILEEGKTLEEYSHPDWRQIFSVGQPIHGLVLESTAETATVKFGSYAATVDREDIAWTKNKRVDQVLRPGDLAVFEPTSIKRADKTIEARLDRIPEVQGAFLALDNKTGAILAMVGGFDFRYSKFNRATQALRQPGSIFKPFTYVVAIEEGKSPFDKLLDAPFYHVDELGRPYEPKNSDGQFKGLIPLEQALAESRNVPTIRLAKALGIEKVIEVAHRFGIDREFVPVLPIALGAGEITLLEITSAFSVFANNGVRAKAYYINRVEDYNGKILEDYQTEYEQVVSPDVSAKMLYLLKKVVQQGTAWRAKALNRPMAGKTGTTDEATDTWFVGIVPQMTAGIWVGYDEKKTLGEEMFGANLALPIYIDFMKAIADQLPVEDFQEVYEPVLPQLASGPADPSQSTPQPGSISVEEIPPPATNLEEEEEGEEPETRPGTEPTKPPRQPPRRPPPGR